MQQTNWYTIAMNTIKDISTNELKALAYDNLAQIEQCQINIKTINQELTSRQTPPVAPQEPQGEEQEEQVKEDQLMKESALELKYILDKAVNIEDVSYTTIEIFPEHPQITSRITYTIYLK